MQRSEVSRNVVQPSWTSQITWLTFSLYNYTDSTCIIVKTFVSEKAFVLFLCKMYHVMYKGFQNSTSTNLSLKLTG